MAPNKSQAGVAGGSDGSWFSANLNNINTNGFNAYNGTEPDKDGYHNQAATLRGGYHLANGATAELNALRSEGDSKYDGSYVNESSSVQQVLGGKVSFAPMSIWQATLSAGQSRDQSDNFKDGAFMSRFNTQRNSATWQNDITIGDSRLLTVGLDRLIDHVDSTTGYDINSRGNSALFTQYQGAVGMVDMQLSLRRDDNDQFGKHSTGGVAFGSGIGKGLRGTLSYYSSAV